VKARILHTYLLAGHSKKRWDSEIQKRDEIVRYSLSHTQEVSPLLFLFMRLFLVRIEFCKVKAAWPSIFVEDSCLIHYTRLWVQFGPRGKDLCERGEWTHLKDLTKLHLLVKTTEYRPDPVREPLAPTRDFKATIHMLISVSVSVSPHINFGSIPLFCKVVL
jgi:hypothetical protein